MGDWLILIELTNLGGIYRVSSPHFIVVLNPIFVGFILTLSNGNPTSIGIGYISNTDR